jgi:hypothetical protein
MKNWLAALALLVCSAPAFAADLEITFVNTPSLIQAGYDAQLNVAIRNLGPDTAENVKVTITGDMPTTCGQCDVGKMPAQALTGRGAAYTAPKAGTTLTFTATVTSSTSDANPANNTATMTITVSTDPDIFVRIFFPPTIVELGESFDAPVELFNGSFTDAHDVNVTYEFRPDVAIVSMPPACTSPAAGVIQCHVDVLPARAPSLLLPIRLMAAQTYGSGTIIFNVTVTEREHDFDPSSNTATAATLLYDTIYVTTTADDGQGSLRQAILDANARCVGPQSCEIAFHIADGAEAGPWKTIRLASPLPRLTAMHIRLDGTTQTRFGGDSNPDGPEIEISGGGIVDGDGLYVTRCTTEVAGFAIGGFRANGLSIAASPNCAAFNGTDVHGLFLGTDPTGSVARPNSRGLGTSIPNGNAFNSAGPATTVHDCVISGNTYSGIFGLSGRLIVTRSRIGVKAHSDDPLPNGNAGVFIGPGGYGSDVGSTGFTNAGSIDDPNGNVIAFNGQAGVAVASGVHDVAIRNNRIWNNGGLGIDIGLDGPTPSPADLTAAPVITLAYYDPALGKTVVEGDVSPQVIAAYPQAINIYANDASDPSGNGEGQRPVAALGVPLNATHFRSEIPGDLTGQFVAATFTRVNYVGFAKPLGIEQGLLTQTSEFSPTIEVR